MSRGFFGRMFDFNNDGKMDAFERAAEFQFFNEVITKNDNDVDEDDDYLSEDDDALDDALADAGLDRDELMWMDEDERREALEDAGLDPMDFDDF